MKRRRILTVMAAGMMAASLLGGCGAKPVQTAGEGSVQAAGDETAKAAGDESAQPDEESKVLRVGMECAYAPFNWTQETDTTPDGSVAAPIYGSDYYAYG